MESLKKLYKIGSGPSSSHTMGPEAAANYIIKKYPEADEFTVYLYGSLALTGKGHLTDYIFKKTLGSDRTKVVFDYVTKVEHPNTLKIETYCKKKLISTDTIISIGGGSIYIPGEMSESIENIYPFNNFKEIREYATSEGMSLNELVYKFEGEDIKEYLNLVLNTMEESIRRGIDTDGILPGGLNVIRKAKMLSQATNSNDSDKQKIISFAYAVAEENASGGRVVTAPTCGSSGVLPAILFYLKEKNNIPTEKLIDGLAVAGLIGNVVKTNASISGACAGCQSEIGTASSMAASLAAYLSDGNTNEIECAAEIAMEHFLGLTCDPVEGLVQIPCIERNAIAALRAIDSAFLARLIKDSEIVSFDTVVNTMYETGKDLNEAYRETATGGLAKNASNRKKDD